MDRRHCLASLAGAAASFASRATSSNERSARAAAALGAIESRTGGRLGVQVTDAAGLVLLGHRAAERFPMCSTFKALAVAAVLQRVDRGQESLDRRLNYTKKDLLEYAPEAQKHVDKGMTMAELCQAAVELSDNTAANLILASLGGPPAVTGFARGLGDPVTRLDRDEPSLNDVPPGDERDTTTPAAMAGDLRALLLGEVLAPGSRERLRNWMHDCKTGDDALRAGMPPHSIVIDKTGAGPRGTRNDIGIAWMAGGAPRVIAVYLTGAKVGRPEQGAVIAEVARTLAALAT